MKRSIAPALAGLFLAAAQASAQQKTVPGKVTTEQGTPLADVSSTRSPTRIPWVTRTGVSFLGGRIYTIGARGDITVTSTTATNRPILDNTANR